MYFSPCTLQSKQGIITAVSGNSISLRQALGIISTTGTPAVGISPPQRSAHCDYWPLCRHTSTLLKFGSYRKLSLRLVQEYWGRSRRIESNLVLFSVKLWPTPRLSMGKRLVGRGSSTSDGSCISLPRSGGFRVRC